MAFSVEVKLIKNYINLFLRAVFAGMVVSFACILFINFGGPWGAVLFSVGLIVILCLNLGLFTGMAGFDASHIRLVAALVGNLLGAFVSSIFLKFKITNPTNLQAIVSSKFSTNLLHTYISAIICGVLIFTAIKSYKAAGNFLPVVACVAAFVALGADHSIANSFYYFAALAPKETAALNILICVLGNYTGAYLSKFAVDSAKKT